MKYLTPEWWNLEVEDMNAPVEAYRRYIDSIRPKLTPDLVALVDAVSLHDSKLRELLVDAPGRSMKLVLDGWVNPWSPDYHPRRFTLMYQGVRSFQLKSSKAVGLELCGLSDVCGQDKQLAGGNHGSRLFGNDLGYHELECVDDGAFEHRMLFASGAELIVGFEDLHLTYMDLQEPVV